MAPRRVEIPTPSSRVRGSSRVGDRSIRIDHHIIIQGTNLGTLLGVVLGITLGTIPGRYGETST